VTAYADAARPPRTMTALEQSKLLKVTGQHRSGYRDHVIISLALGMGLREHEIAALDVGDVLRPDGRIQRRVALRVFKSSAKDPAPQEVFVPDTLWHKLARYIEWKRLRDESVDGDAPLFLSRLGKRIATRTLRHLFQVWQGRAGLDRPFNFHALRHTSLTNAYRATRDIRLVQRLARHKSVDTTTIYAAVADEDLFLAVKTLPC